MNESPAEEEPLVADPVLEVVKESRKPLKEFTAKEYSNASIARNFRGLADGINDLHSQMGELRHTMQDLVATVGDQKQQLKDQEKRLIILEGSILNGIGSGSTTPGDMIRKRD